MLTSTILHRRRVHPTSTEIASMLLLPTPICSTTMTTVPEIPRKKPVSSTRRLPTPLLSALVLLCAVLYSAWITRPLSVLSYISASQFDWGASTTDIPISAVSVLLKRLLARDDASLPHGLRAVIPSKDTVEVQRVRNFLNAQRLDRLRQICKTRRCIYDEQDPHHGLTALHVAAFSDDGPLMQFLHSRGAQHVEDHVHRLPRNLTFQNFMANSKKWARAAGRHDCDFPVVNYDGSEFARKEVGRLVSEGEPVLIRNALRVVAPELLNWEPQRFVLEHGDVSVKVGSVPYAEAFNLTTSRMTLRDYYEKFVVPDSDAPLYVFSKGPSVCKDGYDALVRLMKEAFPMPSLVEHPDRTGGLDGIHFFLGRQGSGAPFHLHADAINAAVSGVKQWYVYTPSRALYSRTPIKKWVDEELGALDEVDKPMQCTQRPGDVVYVPLDWGHAVLNMEENTYGFALEILNSRDTLMHVAGRGSAA